MSFAVESSFTNIPIVDTEDILKTKQCIAKDTSDLIITVWTAYTVFPVFTEGTYYILVKSALIGSRFLPVVANLHMEEFEYRVIGLFDDNLNLKGIHSDIKFTIETETNNSLPFPAVPSWVQAIPNWSKHDKFCPKCLTHSHWTDYKSYKRFTPERLL